MDVGAINIIRHHFMFSSSIQFRMITYVYTFPFEIYGVFYHPSIKEVLAPPVIDGISPFNSGSITAQKNKLHGKYDIQLEYNDIFHRFLQPCYFTVHYGVGCAMPIGSLISGDITWYRLTNQLCVLAHSWIRKWYHLISAPRFTFALNTRLLIVISE